MRGCLLEDVWWECVYILGGRTGSVRLVVGGIWERLDD